MKGDKMAVTKADPYQDPTYNQQPAVADILTTEQPYLTTSTQACINECLDCHKTCLSEAMTRCLEMGGAHVEPHHFRLLLNCAEICQASANFMLMNSPLHTIVCDVCAQVCEACAQSCDEVEGMAECAAQCRKCATSCREMSMAVA